VAEARAGLLEGTERVANAAEDHFLPCLDAGNEFLSQPGVREARGPELRLHPDEARSEIVLVEAACLRPLLREAPCRVVHAALPLEEPSIGGIQDLHDELVLRMKVIVDERVFTPASFAISRTLSFV